MLLGRVIGTVVCAGRRRHRRAGRRGAELSPGGPRLKILARITGSIVSTIHYPVVDGRRMLLAERLDHTGEPTGGYLIATDSVGVGEGETALIQDEGSGARQILGDSSAPVRSIIVGIVDTIADL